MKANNLNEELQDINAIFDNFVKNEINNIEIENMNTEQLKGKIKDNFKKHKSHTIYFKCLVIELSSKYGKQGKKYAANLPNCSLNSIYDWEKQYDKLKANRKQNAKKLSGGGRKSII